MRAVGTGRTAASDEALLAQARAGIPAAFDELYARHRGAALRLARSYRRGADGEDLVSEAFERVLGALLGGHGPAEHFRAYLFVTLRRLALEESRQPRSEPLEAVPEAVVAVSGLPTLEEAERRRIALAFESLPERWQAVLWLTAVEGRPPREVARSAGIPANTVSVLAHRARERLREAYLQAHLRAARHPACEPHRSRLGGYVRGGLSRRHRTAMVEHLETCASCRELVVELTDVDRRLVRAVLPLFALASGGSVAPGVVGAGGAVGGAALAGQAAGEGAGLAGAVGATSTTAGTGAGAGVAGAGALKVAVAAAAAVVALTASLLPDLTGPRDDDTPPALAADAPPGYAPPEAAAVPSAEGTTTTRTAAASATTAVVGSPTPGDASAPTTDTTSSTAPADPPPVAAPSTTAATLRPDPGGEVADVQVGVELGPVLDVEADLEVGPGIELDASWSSAPLGTGTLTVGVANPGGGPARALAIDIELSAHTRATTLLSGCQASDPGLVGAVLSLVGALTCPFGDLVAGAAATIAVPLHVSRPGQTATVAVRAGAEVLDTTVLDLLT